MGSVIEYIECPNCGHDHCFSDYYYKTGEEYTNCPECGFQEIHRMKRGEDGELIPIEPDKPITLDNVQREHLLIDKPFGCYRIKSKDVAGTTHGVLATEEDYHSFVGEVVSLLNQPNDLESVVVKRYVNGEHTEEIVYERKPLNIGDKVFVTENVRATFGFEDGLIFTIVDILEDQEYNYVVNCEEFGKDWKEFFCNDELIPIEK